MTAVKTAETAQSENVQLREIRGRLIPLAIFFAALNGIGIYFIGVLTMPQFIVPWLIGTATLIVVIVAAVALILNRAIKINSRIIIWEANGLLG